MKAFIPTTLALSFALSLAACSQSDHYDDLQQTIAMQNKTITQQQQMLMDQSQQLSDQETRISLLTQELGADEQAIKALQDGTGIAAEQAAPKPTQTPGVDLQKSKIVKSLNGFEGRMSSSLDYDSYTSELSDLDADLAQALLEVKDQNFVDSVNKILRVYNLAGEFWDRYGRDTDDVVLSSTDRYRYSTVGVLFVENYHPRSTDVRKFWKQATTDLDDLMQTNKDDLGLPDWVATEK